MFRTFLDWVVLRKTAGPSKTAVALFSHVVDQARRPEFYQTFGVSDTLDGRFDLLALHLFLIMRRLKHGGEAGRILAQELANLLVSNLDETLREMGVGDLSVGKRVKHMVQAFYGRVAAYERALLVGDTQDMEDAVRKNLYRDQAPSDRVVAEMAFYIRRNTERFEAMRNSEITADSVAFEMPEEISA